MKFFSLFVILSSFPPFFLFSYLFRFLGSFFMDFLMGFLRDFLTGFLCRLFSGFYFHFSFSFRFHFFFRFLLALAFFSISFSCLGLKEEPLFQLKREIRASKKKTKKQTKGGKQNSVPLKFQRHSFSYSEDFVVFNEKPKSHLKAGAVLKVHIPDNVIAVFDEEFQVYGVVVSPFRAVVLGKVRAIKSANKALIIFDEIILNGEKKAIGTFPLLLNGDLKESLFKDIVLNFSDSLPSILALALKTQVPQTGLHFITTDFKDKIAEFSNKEREKKKNQRLEYLKIKNTELLKLVVK